MPLLEKVSTDPAVPVVNPVVSTNPYHEFHPLESWRSILAGLVAVGIGVYDVWKLGPNEGLTVEIDEILILVGIGLIAGMPNVFLKTLMGSRGTNGKTEETKPEEEKKP